METGKQNRRGGRWAGKQAREASEEASGDGKRVPSHSHNTQTYHHSTDNKQVLAPKNNRTEVKRILYVQATTISLEQY